MTLDWFPILLDFFSSVDYLILSATEVTCGIHQGSITILTAHSPCSRLEHFLSLAFSFKHPKAPPELLNASCAGGILYLVCYLGPILLKVIFQECLEGMSSNFAQMSKIR